MHHRMGRTSLSHLLCFVSFKVINYFSIHEGGSEEINTFYCFVFHTHASSAVGSSFVCMVVATINKDTSFLGLDQVLLT